MPAATTIDEIIVRLDTIIDWARENNSRLGYFPALYRKVTLTVKEEIARGFFEDGLRMHRLDVVFANRYLDAFDAWTTGRPVADSWRIAFQASDDRWAIVLQHLLLGMNAHINVDLGIAAAQTCPGASINTLQSDFERINTVLALLVNRQEAALTRVWPMLHLLDWIAGKNDEEMIKFSLRIAREQAWNVALELAARDGTGAEKYITQLDGDIALLAKEIQHPGPLVGSVTNCIRLGERGSVPEIIDILSST